VFTNWDFAAGFQYLSLVVDATHEQAALVLISATHRHEGT